MKRRKAREYVLQFLYKIDFMGVFKNSSAGKPALKDALKDFWKETDEPDSQIITFSEEIITGTVGNLDKIDSVIQETTEKWKLSRMATVDRNIMRFAVYEMLFRKDIPAAVTINEALEIAKKFSTADSASFINGVLDRIAKEFSGKAGTRSRR